MEAQEGPLVWQLQPYLGPQAVRLFIQAVRLLWRLKEGPLVWQLQPYLGLFLPQAVRLFIQAVRLL